MYTYVERYIENPFINLIMTIAWSLVKIRPGHMGRCSRHLHPVRQRRCYVTTFHRMWWNSVEKRRRWLRESLPGTRKLSEKLTNRALCVWTSFSRRKSSCCFDISKKVWCVSLMMWSNVYCDCRCKMREGALLSSLVLFHLLSFSQAARQGQDMKCGGMRAPALLFDLHKCTSSLDVRSISAPHSLQGSGRWDGVGHFPGWSKENDPNRILQDQPRRQPVHPWGKKVVIIGIE